MGGGVGGDLGSGEGGRWGGGTGGGGLGGGGVGGGSGGGVLQAVTQTPSCVTHPERQEAWLLPGGKVVVALLRGARAREREEREREREERGERDDDHRRAAAA